MAQHYPVYKRHEPALFTEISLILKELVERWEGLPELKQVEFQGKTVMRLPDEYVMEFEPRGTKVVSMHPFTLVDERWDERENEGMDFRQNANLEIHFLMTGEIVNVYYPL